MKIKSYTSYILLNNKVMEKQEEKYSKNNHKLHNYEACMILAAVGDAMGYKNGDWQFLTNSNILHKQMMQLTQNKGPLYLDITIGWRYSDDTVMHIATAQALVKCKKNDELSVICQKIGKQYKKCWGRMSGRAPGKTTGKSIKVLNQDGSNWNKIPYNQRACGCGGSMRSACIGLAYYDNIQKVIQISIEAGRMTHHNPIGYLGSVISALFTAYAINLIDPREWVARFIDEALPIAQKYIHQAKRQVKQNLQRGYWQKFIDSVKSYASKRNVSVTLKQQIKQPKFPQKYGIIQRQHFYKQLAWNGWPGALGIDSVLIAYDAFLSSKGSWQELCLRGILHGGDNDSTGTIAGSWYGAYYGMQSVPKRHYCKLQDNKKIFNLGKMLFELE